MTPTEILKEARPLIETGVEYSPANAIYCALAKRRTMIEDLFAKANGLCHIDAMRCDSPKAEVLAAFDEAIRRAES